MGEKVFALDIGTRTVVGLVLDLKEQPQVIAAEVAEHPNRSMLDGQIHDVPQVADLVVKVKEALEKKTGLQLKSVAVAAAGRALKTAKGSTKKEHNPLEEIDEQMILAAEIEAVQAAQSNLVETEQRISDYHCVGYSVVRYTLDNHPISNLTGQYGNSIGVDIIATFLPRVVVDSLVTALKRAGLELSSLTLEPIAAINVIVPANLRRLNLALVDIGAGTSDIAITREDTVAGYAMVPSAGDKITEELCDIYLLDFDEGEKVKRQLSGAEETIRFVDVVGMEHELKVEEIIEAVQPAVTELANKIADSIFQLNGKAPQAVIAIGGGSQTPLLTKELAAKLSLPQQRVAVRGREALTIKGEEDILFGPQAVTPIGIAVSWKHNRALEFSSIKVNNRPVRLISANGRGTVADALLAAGINIRLLYGKPGLGLSVTVNGKVHFIKGSLGKPAKLLVNGEAATLETAVQDGYQIQLMPGEKGKDAEITLNELINETCPPLYLIVNGEKRTIKPRVLLNGSAAQADEKIPDMSEVKVKMPSNAGETLQWLGVISDGKDIYINGAVGTIGSPIKSGDDIELKNASAVPLAQNTTSDVTTHLTVNQQPMEIRKSHTILTDMFNYIDFNPNPPTSSSKLLMQVNGQKAQFTTVLKDGDDVMLCWQEEVDE